MGGGNTKICDWGANRLANGITISGQPTEKCGGRGMWVRLVKEVRALGQPVPEGVSRCRGPVGGVRFVEDVAHVAGHGVGADEQVPGDLAVVLAQGNETQDLHLP